MGTMIHAREFINLSNRVMYGRGFARPADTSFFFGLLTTGLSLTAASTAANAASGEVAAANGYARQLFGRTIASIASNTITTSFDHGLVNNDRVTLITTNTLPTGLALGTEYFVINATATTLQLSATQAGAAITITGSGTGTHYLKSSPVFNAGANNRSEAIEDRVVFSATGGDITYQGYFLMCGTTATRGDSTNSTLVAYEYFGSPQTLSNGDSRIIRVRLYTSNQGVGVGI